MELSAIAGDKTIAELAVLHDVYPNQIAKWKRQLVDRAADVFGGEPNTPPMDLKVLHAKIGQPILERYGMSETVMLVSNPYKGDRVGGSVGLPLPGVKVRVVNENNKPCGVDEIGSIQVKGSNIFKGYWRTSEKTAEEFKRTAGLKLVTSVAGLLMLMVVKRPRIMV